MSISVTVTSGMSIAITPSTSRSVTISSLPVLQTGVDNALFVLKSQTGDFITQQTSISGLNTGSLSN